MLKHCIAVFIWIISLSVLEKRKKIKEHVKKILKYKYIYYGVAFVLYIGISLLIDNITINNGIRELVKAVLFAFYVFLLI